ncbi:MAG: DNA translocase FtsK [Candidatus Moranbacteria bacterium]|nr:DNA translocase FtsK [Candidatus Moranbacteria bacterium]
MGRKKNTGTANKRGRKRKEEVEVEEDETSFLSIGSDAKRSVAAVFLFALGLISALGFFGASGVIGSSLNGAVGTAVGWVKFIFPLFLVLAGIILLFRKETSFYVVKILGLLIVFVALTGFFHWFYTVKEMSKFASLGEGGGYLGFGVAYLLTKYLGSAGSLIMIVCLIIIGVIVAFEFSLADFIMKFKRAANQKDEVLENGDEDGMEDAEESFEEEENIEVKSEQPAEESDMDANIAKIEFVEGRDRFVDKRLLSDKHSADFNQEKKPDNPSAGRSIFSRRSKWKMPPFNLLENTTGEAKGGDVERNAEIIKNTLHNFGIEVERGDIKTGPSVTQYSFRPAVGVKISKILSLQNDLALALAAHPIRIEAPIPGKSMIGIEVPNKSSSIVGLRGILESKDFKNRSSNLTLALGEDVSGSYLFDSLDRMPHLMIAGSTGTGKSVSVNAIITALLYQNSPDDLKFIMVDPKRVELSLYNGIPHLLTDVIVENNKVVNALKWAVGEMERRYKLLQESGSRDVISYKEKIKNGEKKKCVDKETGEVSEEEYEYLPYIVILIDELADLMGSHGKEVEGAIVRIAQMARAVGIHLIVSTQRPSVEVITGLIKANIATRIAFQVASQIDSRTIIDMAGAEKLLGRGDMLYASASSPKPVRIQGVYVSETEVKKVVNFIKEQKEALGIGKDDGEDDEAITDNGGQKSDGAQSFSLDAITSDSDQEDSLYEAAKAEVMRAKKASASLLQRRLRVGYARAARLLDILEDNGVVGPSEGAKPREVYGADGPSEISYDDSIDDQEKRDKWNM